jgi:hypothetical protein
VTILNGLYGGLLMGFNWLRIKFSDWILTSIDGV